MRRALLHAIERRTGAVLALVAALACVSASSPACEPRAAASDARVIEAKDSDIAALEKQLKDPSDKTRREAVQQLAKLASGAAWELVIDALKDVSPMVADEAQVQLGTLSEAKIVEALLGKKGLGSSDEWTRLRVAEAFGRMPGKPPLTQLAGHLSDKSADVRRALAWSIERLARAHRKDIDTSESVYVLTVAGRASLQDKDVGVRAAALLAAAALEDSKDSPFAQPLLADKAADVRCAALIDALDWPVALRFDSAKKLLVDPQASVRAQAIETLGACRSKAACALLVERLEQEKSLRLRWRIVDQLQKLSGSDLELEVPFWKKWVEGLDDSWEPKTGEPRKREAKKPAEGTAVFMGLPVLSERVAILVDFSGSTWEKRENGKTRKETLDEELTKLLKQLTPATKFNLVPYTKDPIPWQKTLMPATPDNVAKALDFFTKCKESGKGNVWDAIELAAGDPEVDTMVVLTDGAPTGGHRWNLELMESLLAERLRFKKIAVDAILVDAKRFLTERWEKICAATGGHAQTVEMK